MLVSMQNYTFAYPNQPPTLQHVNLDLPQGSLTVLFGQSGSGKTTLLRQLKRVLMPSGTTSGRLLWHDAPLADLDLRTQASAIGYVNQQTDAQFVTDKVWHELAFGLESLGLPETKMRIRVAEMATFFGLSQLMSRDVATLSGGQKQLVSLASVMVMRPDLLILDEPTAQLDPLAKQTFIQMLVRLHNDLGTTILIAEHDLDGLLPFTDQLVMMSAGRIVATGTPQSVAAQLATTNDPLLAAFPPATRLFCHHTPNSVDRIPLSVGAGRAWFANQPHPNYDQPASPSPVAEPILTARHVSFRYTPNADDVLTDVSLTIEQGDWFGIVGNNGSGKSTLLSLLGRILQPNHGRITLAHQNIARYPQASLYREFLAILPQDPTTLFASPTVQSELMATAKQTAPAMGIEAAVSGAIDLCHLRPLLKRHPFDLSGGERQLLALAKIILLRPKVLLLDEPTKGLDAFTKRQVGTILDQLQQAGVTLVMVTHDLDFIAQHANHVALLFNGEITTAADTHTFFAHNNFYTTSASRIARDVYPWLVTDDELQMVMTDKTQEARA